MVNTTCSTTVFVTLVIIVFVVLSVYLTQNRPKLFLPSSTKISSSDCRLSLIESDGWFCESDKDWTRRKTLHTFQHKRNHINDNRFLFFQNNWEPTIQCASEQRLGNTGDGGKWICDVYRYQEMNDTNLLVYSFGSQGDFSFERAVKQHIPRSEIHTFDMGVYQCPPDLCTFHQTRLGDGKTAGSKSLQMVIRELGHQRRTLQILKVDIEGSEFDLFEHLFQPLSLNGSDLPYIRQILFEIHLGSGQDVGASRRTHQLFDLFHKNHYAIFHKEVNLYDPQNVFEYGLIRLNSAFFA